MLNDMFDEFSFFFFFQAEDGIRDIGVTGVQTCALPISESAADCVRAWCDWREPRATPEAPPVAHALPDRPDEADARRLFAALGLDSPFAVLRTPQDAPPADLAFPVALKILSPDLAHKTELGGVRLNVATPDALKQEAAAMHYRVARMAPEARLTGFLVQPMARGLDEAILGLRRDPEVGPVVLLGTGGIAAEVFRDVALRLAPVTEGE